MEEIVKEEKDKLATASSFIATMGGMTAWETTEVDKLEITGLDKFNDVVADCRFFYKRDPIASTVCNKLVEIGITDLVLDQGQLSDNEFRIFLGIKDKIQRFIESCALEYLISGFLVPEINYGLATKKVLMKMGVKKYEAITLPIDMWVRDPTTIKINSTKVLDRPSYFIIVPDELVYFIMNEGVYPDGNKDPALWVYLQTYYQEFIDYVMAGNKEIPYDNPLIVRRKVITESPYPIPFLYPALEALKHKRNLRRMDYSIASRVISAILLIKLGNDLYPVLEEDEDAFASIRDQMAWRGSYNKNMERIFQLFANHTLQMEWVFPDVGALIDDKKYYDINQDIFFSMGFPRILTTGETERTSTSDPNLATVSPIKSMETMQNDLLTIVEDIIYEISIRNKFKDTPKVRFEHINLYAIDQFRNILTTLYNGGNISRETLDAAFGYTYAEEVKKRAQEEKELQKLEIPGVSPLPYSPNPQVPGTSKEGTPNPPKENKQNSNKPPKTQ